MNTWWTHDRAERFWLEITDRDRLGDPLIGAYEGASGRSIWHGELISHVKPDDVVLHYYTPWQAILGWSRAFGPPQRTTLPWTPRSAGGREGPVVDLPAWSVRLRRYHELPETEYVTLEDMRDEEAALLTMRSEVEAKYGKPVYFPFVFSDSRPLRPAQAYLAKVPEAFVAWYPQLHDSV